MYTKYMHFQNKQPSANTLEFRFLSSDVYTRVVVLLTRGFDFLGGRATSQKDFQVCGATSGRCSSTRHQLRNSFFFWTELKLLCEAGYVTLISVLKIGCRIFFLRKWRDHFFTPIFLFKCWRVLYSTLPDCVIFFRRSGCVLYQSVMKDAGR